MGTYWKSHTICDPCWLSRNPTREAVRMRTEFIEGEPSCCYCGTGTMSGIHVRGHVDDTVFCTCADD